MTYHRESVHLSNSCIYCYFSAGLDCSRAPGWEAFGRLLERLQRADWRLWPRRLPHHSLRSHQQPDQGAQPPGQGTRTSDPVLGLWGELFPMFSISSSTLTGRHRILHQRQRESQFAKPLQTLCPQGAAVQRPTGVRPHCFHAPSQSRPWAHSADQHINMSNLLYNCAGKQDWMKSATSCVSVTPSETLWKEKCSAFASSSFSSDPLSGWWTSC